MTDSGFMDNIFYAYLINSLDFLTYNSLHFTPQVKLYFVEKGT